MNAHASSSPVKVTLCDVPARCELVVQLAREGEVVSGAAAAIIVDVGRRDRLPAETVDRIELRRGEAVDVGGDPAQAERRCGSSEEPTSELQSLRHLVC